MDGNPKEVVYGIAQTSKEYKTDFYTEEKPNTSTT